MIPGTYSNPANLTFDWTVVGFDDGKTLELQLNFDHPIFVSANNPSDTLQINYWDRNLFMAIDGVPIIEEMKNYKLLSP